MLAMPAHWQQVPQNVHAYPSCAQGGGQNGPFLRFVMNYFLSYADSTDIFACLFLSIKGIF